ncbi:unnamed protein product, partial [Allacma fusca]
MKYLKIKIKLEFKFEIKLSTQLNSRFSSTSNVISMSTPSLSSSLNQIYTQKYFIGVPNGRPGERHLYRVSEKSSNTSVIPSPECLTCPGDDADEGEDPEDAFGPLWLFPDGNGTDGENTSIPSPLPTCLFNNVIFSPNHKFFVRECLGPGVPTVTLHGAPSGRLLLILNNNTALKDEVANMGMPIVRTFTV